MAGISDKIPLKLSGLDGNAFSIMGAFQAAAKKHGWTAEKINEVINTAMEGDYNHLLRTFQQYVEDPLA